MRLLLCIILFFPTRMCPAQQLQVENYTPANGLLDTRVIKIFQDDRGLMYFLTWEGISIFDGQRFKNISEYNGESLGLVNDMIQWKKDTCYIFTFQKGVYKLIHNRLIKDTLFNQVAEPNHVVKTDDNKYIITSNIGLALLLPIRHCSFPIQQQTEKLCYGKPPTTTTSFMALVLMGLL